MPRERNWKWTREWKESIYILVLALVLVVFLVVALTCMIIIVPQYDKTPGAKNRIECLGLKGKYECEEKGCTYEYAALGPMCFMEPGAFGYSVDPDALGFPRIKLKERKKKTPYGRSLESVVFQFTYLTENILRFQFITEEEKRYQVPVQDEFPLLKNLSEIDESQASYYFQYNPDAEWFSFEIWRKKGKKLWDTSIGGLVLTNQFLQIASYLPSSRIYGIGENTRNTFKRKMNYRKSYLFSSDTPPMEEEDNLYGVHPFYTCLEYDGKSHGVLLLNSNLMQITVLPAPAITFTTTGGVLDFFMFIGDNPEHVVQLYTSLIGRPMMPPYWALGFQLSRYGYNNLATVEKVIERTRGAGIAQDVQFLDIDHMQGSRDFTFNKMAFRKLPDFIQKTKAEYGLKWIIILNPGIASDETYTPYTTGVEADIFIRKNKFWKEEMFPEHLQSSPFVYGMVWPIIPVAFPDFLLNGTQKWWTDNIVEHHKTIQFDGLWIDMNEPAAFGTNIEYPDYCKWLELGLDDCWSLKCEKGLLDFPAYNPLGIRLSTKTICMDSEQVMGNYSHYNVHSLYGWSQTRPTYEAAQEATGQRSINRCP